MTAGDELTKVLVELPNHWATGGESLWAKSLGDDLYELDNSPFYAYDLNYMDVVKAIASSPDLKPVVLSVARRGGHKTLRVIFGNDIAIDRHKLLLQELDGFGVTWEGSGGSLYALDIPSDSEYQSVCDHLWELENKGVLEYETCEARVPGTFDSAPANVS